METITKAVVTLSITINCPYETAFEYLSVPVNQKEWAVHFYQNIEEIDGKTIATVPFGKFSMEIKSDRDTGVLDIYLGENGKPICTRLVNIDEHLNIYNFTLSQPNGMPDEVWENKALPDMLDELNTLKTILERK